MFDCALPFRHQTAPPSKDARGFRGVTNLSTTPKLDAEIDRVNQERLAEGLHLLPRHKAIAQIAAERIYDFARTGLHGKSSSIDMIGWLILEPVIEDLPPK
jgi:hypothetical protein